MLTFAVLILRSLGPDYNNLTVIITTDRKVWACENAVFRSQVTPSTVVESLVKLISWLRTLKDVQECKICGAIQ